MFSGRHELVRHEQNKAAHRRAEAHRQAKQLTSFATPTAPRTGMFVWLRSKIFRVQRPLKAEKQMQELKEANFRAKGALAQAEAPATKE